MATLNGLILKFFYPIKGDIQIPVDLSVELRNYIQQLINTQLSPTVPQQIPPLNVSPTAQQMYQSTVSSTVPQQIPPLNLSPTTPQQSYQSNLYPTTPQQSNNSRKNMIMAGVAVLVLCFVCSSAFYIINLLSSKNKEDDREQ